ncbi:13748_t:CDS:2 [Acaulospora morrowiae]|uniref:13748_t:CDS:1 n=1 Tax=Acaulospora morrowiae TaxID=94023 RepID=A0A9N9HEH6_9GLOM|nr:13748_t:CDS:2 [Acaulospora morrowiae]
MSSKFIKNSRIYSPPLLLPHNNLSSSPSYLVSITNRLIKIIPLDVKYGRLISSCTPFSGHFKKPIPRIGQREREKIDHDDGKGYANQRVHITQKSNGRPGTIREYVRNLKSLNQNGKKKKAPIALYDSVHNKKSIEKKFVVEETTAMKATNDAQARIKEKKLKRSHGRRDNYATNYKEANLELFKDFPAWLKGLRLTKYTPLFAKMDENSILKLDNSMLKAKGLTLGARNKLLRELNKVKEVKKNKE